MQRAGEMMEESKGTLVVTESYRGRGGHQWVVVCGGPRGAWAAALVVGGGHIDRMTEWAWSASVQPSLLPRWTFTAHVSQRSDDITTPPTTFDSIDGCLSFCC